MAEISKALTDEQKRQLKANFLTSIGGRLKAKREQRSLSLRKLAEGMPVEASALSKYENGKEDMPLSHLSLYSIYCDFELRELFPPDEMKGLLRSFKASVTVISGSNARRKEKGKADRTLTARIYMQDDIEVREEVRSRIETQRDMYKDAYIQTGEDAFTEEEFCEYLASFDSETRASLCSAGDFLEKIMSEPRRETLKRSVADYIINTAIIDRVCRKGADMAALRAYAYYKRLMEQKGGDGFDVADCRDL